MARKPKDLLDEDKNTEAKWPVVDKYTTEDGHEIRVYRAAHAVESSNKFTARPRKAAHILGV